MTTALAQRQAMNIDDVSTNMSQALRDGISEVLDAVEAATKDAAPDEEADGYIEQNYEDPEDADDADEAAAFNDSIKAAWIAGRDKALEALAEAVSDAKY